MRRRHAAIVEVQQIVTQLRAAREGLERDLKRQNAAVAEMQRTIEALKIAANELLAAERDKLCLSEEREQEAHRNLADAEEKCARLRDELERTKSEGAQTLAMRTADVVRLLAEREGLIREFRSSHSWRVTRPLRWASQGPRHLIAGATRLRRSSSTALYSALDRLAPFRRVRSIPIVRSLRISTRGAMSRKTVTPPGCA